MTEGEQDQLKKIPGLPEVEQAGLEAPAATGDPAVDEAAQLASGASPEEMKKIPAHVGADHAARAATAGEDDDAIKEAKQLSGGKSAEEIAREAAANEHTRNERFRDHFEKMAIFALWVAFGVLILLILSWVAHILLPAMCHWLTPEQLAKVQNLVTGGVVASLAVGHLKKRIGHH